MDEREDYEHVYGSQDMPSQESMDAFSARQDLELLKQELWLAEFEKQLEGA